MRTSEHETKWCTGPAPHATPQMAGVIHATLHAVPHATPHPTLPKCCQWQRSRPGQKNWFMFSFHSFQTRKTPKCCFCKHFDSVAWSVVQPLGHRHQLRKMIQFLLSSWFGRQFPKCQRCFAELVLQNMIWPKLHQAPGILMTLIAVFCEWRKVKQMG